MRDKDMSSKPVKAPRSKGCRVCVLRRIKCDLRQPTCLRCEKAHRQCPGFENINFVDEGPSVRELYQTSDSPSPTKAARSFPSSQSSSKPSSIRIEDHAPFQYLASLHDSSERRSTPLKNAEFQSWNFERSTLVAIMAPAVYQAQLLSAFIESVSSAVPARLAPTMQCHSIWLSEIAKLRTISPTLIWAIRAMSLSHLGRQIQDRNLIQDSRTMYGKALLKLNKALQDPIEGVSSDTLSATVLLSFYEMLNCTERFSWVRHAGGAAKLMRLRGPDRHRTGFGLAVFMSVRYSIILQSIQSREECFLNEPSWRALSREIKLIAPIKTRSSALDDAKEDFFQEFVASPGFLARAINYMEVNGTDREILQDLVREGHIHRSSYKTIWARTIDALCEAGQEPILTPSPSHDKLFPDQYQYPSDLIANFYCGYRTTMTAVNTALIGLEAKLSALQSVSSSREGFEPRDMKNEREVVETANATVNRAGRPQKAYLIRALHSLEWPESPWSEMVTPPRFSSPEPTASPRDYPTMSAKDTISRRNLYLAENVHLARETCRSVEHVAMTAFLGPLFTVFALRVALRVLRSEDEKAWMLEKLDGLAKVLGVAQVEADVYRQEQETPQDQLGSPPELLA